MTIQDWLVVVSGFAIIGLLIAGYGYLIMEMCDELA